MALILFLIPLRSEERRVGKSVDLGGRRIIKKHFFQAEDGIRDISRSDWSSDVCSSDLTAPNLAAQCCLIMKNQTSQFVAHIHCGVFIKVPWLCLK